MKHVWTPARIARLKELLEQGASAAEAAADLGGVTRDAVMCKAAREGFPFMRRKLNPITLAQTDNVIHKPRPRGKGLTTQEISALRRRFVAGMSMKQAAREVHSCERTVLRYYNLFREARSAGTFSLSRKPGSYLTKKEVQNLRSLWERGEPMDRVARQLGITRGCVREWYERFHSGEAHPSEKEPEKSGLPQRHYVGNFDLPTER